MTHPKIQKVARSLSLGLGLSLGSFFVVPAQAQELDGEAVKQLALKGTWEAEHAEYGLWNWNDDGTVCLRLGNKDGDCADTGTWTISDNVLCYELTWWGETVDERKNCFTVQPLDGGRFETLFHGGVMVSRMFDFEVLE